MFRKTHLFGIHAMPPVLGSMQQYFVEDGRLGFGESYISLDDKFYTKRDVFGTKGLFDWKESMIVLEDKELFPDKMASIFIGISTLKYLLIKWLIKWEMRKLKKYNIMKANCMHWAFKKLRLVDKELERMLNKFVYVIDDSAYNERVLGIFGERRMRIFIRAFKPWQGRVCVNVPELAKNITANA